MVSALERVPMVSALERVPMVSALERAPMVFALERFGTCTSCEHKRKVGGGREWVYQHN